MAISPQRLPHEFSSANRPIGSAIHPLSGAREAARRNVVRLVIFVYLLAILEGVLRKWLLPQLSQYLYFVRDPFVLLAYVIASMHQLWPKNSSAMRIGVGVGAVGALVLLLQLAMSGFEETQALLGVYGWRNYFFYVPLAFLIGAVFQPRDIRTVIRFTLLLSVPIAILVAIQFRAAPSAAINVGLAVDGIAQFKGLGLDAEHTRPMGTFTSPTGQTMFLASAFSILLAIILAPANRRPVRWVLATLSLICVLSGIALSGSRYTLVHCGVAISGAVLLGLVTKSSSVRWRALFLPALLAVCAAYLYPIIFPEGFSTISSRWNTAYEVESQQYQAGILGRAVAIATDFVPLMRTVPALGYGLGFGGNASTTLGATVNGVSALNIAESDWSRHIVDFGPLFGSAIIVLRVLLVGWLAKLVFRHTRQVGDPMALMLFSFVAIELLYGQASGHGTVNVYSWLYLGFCLAAMKPRRGSVLPHQIPTQNDQSTRQASSIKADLRHQTPAAIPPWN